VLTPGQAAHCRVAEALLRDLPSDSLVTADGAYDTNAVRQQIQSQGVVPTIPLKRNRL
jgi:IS5 family transposase